MFKQFFNYVLFVCFDSIPVPIITYHDRGGFGSSGILKEMSMVQYLVNMIGLYHGHDVSQLQNIQTEIVSPG